MTIRTSIIAVTVTLLGLGAVACQKRGGGATSDAPVAKIVFIDKKDACDCTRKRADDSWDSLAKAMGDSGKIPIERIYIDADKELAAPYLEMQELMVIPGIYFLDQQGELVAMLQGEQSSEKLATTLGK